eukprot:TRINITY_DN57045_c0_g1_i2.p2 TRINITY_DN57045_c0_g1~~TRINITY_DN57045_c0_g1_i2.p2  ORF type:complete len:248 (-),score=142.37 TRINITY_DN57045_c0_g1_i2:88-831(-)
MADYSKWDALVREEEEAQRRAKEKRALENRMKYMKEQQERKAKWDAEHKDHEHHHHAPSCGCGFGDPDAIRKAAAKKKDEIPLEERNIKKVRAVEATREHGKQLFGEGKYEHAAAVFDRGLLIINGSYSMTDEQQAKLDDLELILESNLAACKLKLERNVEAIRHCKAVLSRDKTNAKAMYRWAEALITMGEYEDARDKVRESIKAHPNNAGFRQQLARVKTLIAQQRDKERQSLLEMQRKMAANKQ